MGGKMGMSKLFKLQTHPGNLYWDPNMDIVASIKCRVEIAGTCTHPRGTLHTVPVPCTCRRGLFVSRHRAGLFRAEKEKRQLWLVWGLSSMSWPCWWTARDQCLLEGEVCEIPFRRPHAHITYTVARRTVVSLHHVHAMGARTVGSSKVWSTPPIIRQFMHFVDACSAIGRGKTASRPDTHDDQARSLSSALAIVACVAARYQHPPTPARLGFP
ncbi:hypothetical protein B0T18DRAFT_214515 [Schizothecium vesticola]|uniref:Uncharacterized protein n=1 Tax=Schizothecium vesticola TaxID=314040 RepID=A0AA40JZE8_9PEZI|nr:hypothetical protein B0T18DRAFT_214515 [Schizothecium vesticola]